MENTATHRRRRRRSVGRQVNYAAIATVIGLLVATAFLIWLVQTFATPI